MVDMKKKPSSKKVISHLKGDIKNFNEEIKEDKQLIKNLKNGKKKNKRSKRR